MPNGENNDVRADAQGPSINDLWVVEAAMREEAARKAHEIGWRHAQHGYTAAKSRTGRDKANAASRCALEIEDAIRALPLAAASSPNEGVDAGYWMNKCEEALKRSGENKARVDAAEGENATLRAVLRHIVEADPIDMALDPQWPSRIAAEALESSK